MVTKTTFYLNSAVQKALKRRVVEADQTMSAYIERAVVQAIADDLDDIEAIEARAGGDTESLEDFFAALKRDGIV